LSKLRAFGYGPTASLKFGQMRKASFKFETVSVLPTGNFISVDFLGVVYSFGFGWFQSR